MRKKKQPNPERMCFGCNHCTYIGEGGYFCDRIRKMVIEDWQPTQNFALCKEEETSDERV